MRLQIPSESNVIGYHSSEKSLWVKDTCRKKHWVWMSCLWHVIDMR